MLTFDLFNENTAIEHGITEKGESAPTNTIIANQVHKDTAIWIDTADQDPGSVDAMVTRKTGITLGVRVADCVPLLFADEGKGIVGVIHAGWRGTALEITRKTMEFLKFSPHTVKVAIGPAIGPESFEVGEEVAKQFPASVVTQSKTTEGKFHVDLWQANVEQLLEVGVSQRNIEVMRLDTFTADNVYSFRAGDRDNRNIAWITLV